MSLEPSVVARRHVDQIAQLVSTAENAIRQAYIELRKTNLDEITVRHIKHAEYETDAVLRHLAGAKYALDAMALELDGKD